MIRTITTIPGLGDLCWIFMKLVNQSEKFHWKVGNGSPQRAHQIFGLFPQLTESFEYIPQSGYKTIKRNCYSGKWSNTPQKFYLEANSHLEAGRRIEKFLPDLKTSFILDYKISNDDHDNARDLLLKPNGYYRATIHKYIGIYTSAYSNARHWGGWESKQWLELIKLIQNYNPLYKFVIIGASYDIGIPDEIMSQLKPEEYINTIGEPLPVVIEILKRLDCFIGFPSGLSIINETLGAKQTVMFYPKHLEKLINTWPDPERIENASYKGCLFCPPEQIFNWMIENKKI